MLHNMQQRIAYCDRLPAAEHAEVHLSAIHAACRYEDTLQVIDNVALPGQHIIVGSSIGAWIALKAAAARRERIRVRGVEAHDWQLLQTACSHVKHLPVTATSRRQIVVSHLLDAHPTAETLQGLVLLAPAVDITELWWQALSAAEQADARATGFVPLGGGTKVGMLHSTLHNIPCDRLLGLLRISWPQ
jgi:pimeloyl-ACP methyl ester carboxylesterase